MWQDHLSMGGWAMSECLSKLNTAGLLLQQHRQLRLGAALHVSDFQGTLLRCAGTAQLGGVSACKPNSACVSATE
jgi:hypothetical protein